MVESRTSVRATSLRDGVIAIILADGFMDLQMSVLAARLNCSKSTLYAIAPSKEQLLVSVVRTFFRRATEQVELAVDPDAPAIERIESYLIAVSAELAPGSDAFFADLERFAPAGDIYRQNTRAAVARVQELVREVSPETDSAFLGVMAGLVMESIHRGDIRRSTGLDDSAAYRYLADLIVAGLSGRQAIPSKKRASR